MGKIRSAMEQEKNFPAGLLFLCGFLTGTIIPNLAYRTKWKQMAAFSIYLLSTCNLDSASGSNYLLEVMGYRGGFLFLCLLSGVTVFGVPLAVLTMFLAGAWMGALLAVSILQFGLSGGAVASGLLFPQYLFYLPALQRLLGAIYTQSGKLWKNPGFSRREVGVYLRGCFLPLLLEIAGILLEVWVNPRLLDVILKLIKIS